MIAHKTAMQFPRPGTKGFTQQWQKGKEERCFDVPAKLKHFLENKGYHQSTVHIISVPNSL